MNRLIICVLFFTLVSEALSGAAAEQEYCSLRVKVEDSSGKPTLSSVAVVTEDGLVVGAKMTDADGLAEFCDAPLGLYHVKVGSNVCGQVLVKYLFENWPTGRSIRVVWESCHTTFLFLPQGGCRRLLRFRDPRGNPLEGVTIAAQSESYRSDRYGRIFLRLKDEERIETWATKAGYKPNLINVDCSRNPGAVVEEVFSMEKE